MVAISAAASAIAPSLGSRAARATPRPRPAAPRGAAVAPAPNAPRRRVVARGGELSWDEADAELLSLDLGDEHASLEVSVSDANTAEVRVRAPDRPGLMRDVTAALTSHRFIIKSASVSTFDANDDGLADNVFVITCDQTLDAPDSFHDADGFECAETIGRVRAAVVEAALNAWSLGAPASAVQYVDPADRTVEPVVDAQVVESSLTKSGKVVVAYVETTDRKGLLAATTAALSDLGCGIIAATVKTTEEGAANNRFVVAAPDGCGPEKIKAALLRIAE